MTKIWPRKFHEKFENENRFKFQNSEEAGKIPARPGEVDWGVDPLPTRSTGESTPGSTWGSTCLVGPRQPGAPVLLFGSVLEACDDF